MCIFQKVKLGERAGQGSNGDENHKMCYMYVQNVLLSPLCLGLGRKLSLQSPAFSTHGRVLGELVTASPALFTPSPQLGL